MTETTNGGLGSGSPRAFMGMRWVCHFFTLCSKFLHVVPCGLQSQQTCETELWKTHSTL